MRTTSPSPKASVPRPSPESRALARGAALVRGAILASLCGLAWLACASAPSQAPPAGQADGPEDGAPMATGVNATVLVGKCPDAPRMKVRTAQEAIQKLVGPCAKVPGGRAHFSATLLPGGKIELASPEGDPSEGVVPTCVLQNRLVHRVPLKSACTLDVQLDERTVVVEPSDAGAPDGG